MIPVSLRISVADGDTNGLRIVERSNKVYRAFAFAFAFAFPHEALADHT